jgi:hypothetical protein
MTGSLEAIKTAFDAQFASARTELPAEALETRTGGHMFDAGWHIGCIWGEADCETYLEYVAQHRMTSDSHCRVWSSGRVESLRALSSMFVLNKGRIR